MRCPSLASPHLVEACAVGDGQPAHQQELQTEGLGLGLGLAHQEELQTRGGEGQALLRGGATEYSWPTLPTNTT